MTGFFCILYIFTSHTLESSNPISHKPSPTSSISIRIFILFLFCLCSVGYVEFKKVWLCRYCTSGLSPLILWASSPVSVLNSLYISLQGKILKSYIYLFLLHVLSAVTIIIKVLRYVYCRWGKLCHHELKPEEVKQVSMVKYIWEETEISVTICV